MFPHNAGDYTTSVYRGALASDDTRIANLAKQLGNEADADSLRSAVDALNRDALAVFFLRNGYDIQALVRLGQIANALNAGLSANKQSAFPDVDVARLDGSSVRMPAEQAYAYLKLGSIYAAKALHRNPPRLRLAGKYNLQTTGNCPIKSGPIELRQDEAIIEGVRGNVPDIIGVIGQSKGFFELPEQSYAVTRNDKSQPNGKLDVQFPETRARFFVAELVGPDLALVPSDGSPCSLTLKGLGS